MQRVVRVFIIPNCSHGRNYKDSEKNSVADITVHYTPEEVSMFGEVDNMLGCTNYW